MTASTVTKDEFKEVMARFAAGVTVVTSVDGEGRPCGLTATAFSSVSLDPPLCLVCIDREAGTYEPMKQSRKFAVNILRDGQEELSNLYASRSDDKFAGNHWKEGEATGCPVFPGALAWAECEVVDIHEAGDHDIFIGKVTRTQIGEEGKPLLYWNGAYGDVTSRPKNW